MTQWFLLLLLLSLRMTIMGRVSLRLFFVLLFVLNVRPFPWLYGRPQVPVLILCFCSYRRLQIYVPWTLVLGRILLIMVCRELGNTLIGSLVPFQCRNPWKLVRVENVLNDLPKLVYSSFVYVLWMEWVLQNLIGPLRLVQ